MHLHRTSGSPNTSRRAGDGGFTLVELLVVITILGILAGIVVFAVRGIGDKGQANAKLADANTLRTAEEANCAQHSQYATVDELVANKLLVSADTLNAISLGDDQKCGNVPGRSSFSIFDANAPTTFLVGSATAGSGISVGAGASPIDIAINPKTDRIYVADSATNGVSVIDGATDTLMDANGAAAGTAIAVGSSPQYIAVNPANNKIYVSNTSDNTVSVIDGATNTVTKTVTFVAGGGATAPGVITVNPVNNDVYVAAVSTPPGIMIIDGTTDATTDLAIPGTGGVAGTAGVAINAKTNTAYVLDGDGSLVAIDGSTHAVADHSLGGITVQGSSFLAVDPSKNRIYVTGFVRIDGTTTGSRFRTITVNGSDYTSTFVQEPAFEPQETQIVVNPNTSQVYSLGLAAAGNSIMHFDPGANRYVGQSPANLLAVAASPIRPISSSSTPTPTGSTSRSGTRRSGRHAAPAA